MLKKNIIFFAVVILSVFALLTYQSIKSKGPSVNFVSYPLHLFSRVSSAVINNISDFFDSYILIVGKEEENRKLLMRINKLNQENNHLLEAKLENERLRKLMEIASTRPDYITSAEVFAREPTNWFNMLWINKGTDQGVLKDMVAVTSLGPVGKIQRVTADSANIILVTDVNSSIAVRLQRSRAAGILEGRGDKSCSLKYVLKEIGIELNEKIITSGLDGIYPEGLVIGYVAEVLKEGGEMFQSIEVKPFQDLSAVEEVAILKR